jgi:hypothetical protein
LQSISHPSGLGLLPVTGGLLPTSVQCVRVLGHGRAAEARLVTATDADGNRFSCVEKVFRPGLLTRTIYRAAFQAPFAYQDDAQAILASFYRRRVAAVIIQTFSPEASVAKPLYVRWDHPSQAMVLASEFIRGRGVVPQPVDSKRCRRWFASKMTPNRSVSVPPAAEIDELVALMTKLESLLVRSGLTGSGWQVCKRAMVSTANLLRTENGYVVVDLESGIPSVLVPAYVFAGFRLGTLPLFDDLDPVKLRSWIAENHDSFAQSLSQSELAQFTDDVERLIEHDENWKRSEPAIARRPTRLVTADFRQRFKHRTLESWSRRGIADSTVVDAMRHGGRFFTSLTFLLGIIPGRIGRFFQRLWANTTYRETVKQWIGQPEYRAATLRGYAAEKTAQWRQAGRIADDSPDKVFNARFIGGVLLSKTTPALLHRWIVDPVYRKNRQTRMLLFCVSGRFQSEIGRLFIRARIESWRGEQRLTATEAASLHAQLASPAVDEYVRGFGLHVGLKLLLPVVMSLKVGGAAVSVASGNPFYFLFMLMLVPMLRTAVTLWRKVATRRPMADYRDALAIGILPVVGSLAFPVQMYSRFPSLSVFLLRDFASRVGRWLPIYGGKDSRTELAAIRSVDLLAELLEIGLATTGSKVAKEREVPAFATIDSSDSDSTKVAAISIGRWDRLVRTQMRLLHEETGLNPEWPIAARASHTDGIASRAA